MSEISEIWQEWKEEELLGKGSFGSVYKIKKEDFGKTYYAAVKKVSVPQDEYEVKELLSTGMDMDSINEYCKDVLNNLINEIQIMESLKTAGNIVSIEDYKLIENSGNLGGTLYIRMELLQSLEDYLVEFGKIDLEEVIKIGIDICSAIECCEMVNTIHRDIKPSNIFRNIFGTYKLGDFGVSKQKELAKSVKSQKGTQAYMAPEVYRGESYDNTVDIYSLGITLFKLLNNQRFPFMPPYPERIRPGDIEEAMVMRMSGEAIPNTQNGNDEISNIIRKACAYNKENRYKNATEMKNDLIRVQMLDKFEGLVSENNSKIEKNNKEMQKSVNKTLKSFPEIGDKDKVSSEIIEKNKNVDNDPKYEDFETTYKAFGTRMSAGENKPIKEKDETFHKKEINSEKKKINKFNTEGIKKSAECGLVKMNESTIYWNLALSENEAKYGCKKNIVVEYYKDGIYKQIEFIVQSGMKNEYRTVFNKNNNRDSRRVVVNYAVDSTKIRHTKTPKIETLIEIYNKNISSICGTDSKLFYGDNLLSGKIHILLPKIEKEIGKLVGQVIGGILPKGGIGTLFSSVSKGLLFTDMGIAYRNVSDLPYSTFIEYSEIKSFEVITVRSNINNELIQGLLINKYSGDSGVVIQDELLDFRGLANLLNDINVCCNK